MCLGAKKKNFDLVGKLYLCCLKTWNLTSTSKSCKYFCETQSTGVWLKTTLSNCTMDRTAAVMPVWASLEETHSASPPHCKKTEASMSLKPCYKNQCSDCHCHRVLQPRPLMHPWSSLLITHEGTHNLSYLQTITLRLIHKCMLLPVIFKMLDLEMVAWYVDSSHQHRASEDMKRQRSILPVKKHNNSTTVLTNGIYVLPGKEIQIMLLRKLGKI